MCNGRLRMRIYEKYVSAWTRLFLVELADNFLRFGIDQCARIQF